MSRGVQIDLAVGGLCHFVQQQHAAVLLRASKLEVNLLHGSNPTVLSLAICTAPTSDSLTLLHLPVLL
jgi:hypothetical protein